MKLLFLFFLLLGHASAGIHVQNLWQTNAVEVCFARGEARPRVDAGVSFKIRDWSEEDKAKIRAWITVEYSAKKTGIHFTGWKSCEEARMSDVILFFNDKSMLMTALLGGQYIKGRAGALGAYPRSVPGYPYAQNSVVISSGGMEKGSVVHEFGHVAGLGHEHTHPESAKRGRACSKINPSFHRSYVYTAYDATSIMSYCSLESKLSSLSQSDRKLLKSLYP